MKQDSKDAHYDWLLQNVRRIRSRRRKSRIEETKKRKQKTAAQSIQCCKRTSPARLLASRSAAVFRRATVGWVWRDFNDTKFGYHSGTEPVSASRRCHSAL
jgi:hypothetical protein